MSKVNLGINLIATILLAQVVYVGNGWIAEDSYIALTGATLVTYVIIGVLLNLIHLMLKKKDRITL